jgi:hypothetical protein
MRCEGLSPVPVHKLQNQQRQKLACLVIVLSGIILGQFVLFGPSLVGSKLLLPLDLLAAPEYYIPQTPGLITAAWPHNTELEDLVTFYEPSRRHLYSEMRSGHVPLWNPYEFAGVPDISPKFSPFFVLSALVASPSVIPWVYLLEAIVAGLGAYLFCRRALQVAFWPAAIVAWCYPLTGFFVLWQGFLVSTSVVWLPWLFLAVERTAKRTSAMAPIGLGLATCMVLGSGQLDVAGQVLLASSFYGAWCLWDSYSHHWLRGPGRGAILSLVAGWGLGFLLAAPAILPVLDYTHTGARMSQRSEGMEERPPVGLAALPQVVLPKMYGSYEWGSFPIFPKNQPALAESTAAAYTGVLETLLLAPLAMCSRRHRAANVFWVFLGFFALSWSLNVPGFVQLLRLPGLNMMSHNRFVFAFSFAILALTATGLDFLQQEPVRWRSWFWAPTALLAGLCFFCVCRALSPPEQIEQLSSYVLQGKRIGWIQDMEGIKRVQWWFARSYLTAAGLCAFGIISWLLLWARKTRHSWFVPLLGLVLVGDLLCFAYGRMAQCDPELYYPPVPVLEAIRTAAPGRFIGYDCLPSRVAEVCGLHDVRGYDAVDPARLVELVAKAAGPQSYVQSFARTQWLKPKVAFTPDGNVLLSPILDMLAVRYVVFRGSPAAGTHPVFQSPDYWVMVNSNALPRAFVPERIEVETDADARLEKLASPDFNPRRVAYVESPVDLPASCRG